MTSSSGRQAFADTDGLSNRTHKDERGGVFACIRTTQPTYTGGPPKPMRGAKDGQPSNSNSNDR